MSDAFDDFADSGSGIDSVWIRPNGKKGIWKFDDDDKGPSPKEQFALIIFNQYVSN
jgi:hypothetical protein